MAQKETSNTTTAAKATPKRTARKASASKPAAKRKPAAAKAKATPRKATAKPAAKAKAPQGVTMHLPQNGTPYAALGSSEAGAAFTAAAMVATGVAKLSAAGTLTAGKGGKDAMRRLAKLTGSGPVAFHRRNRRFNADGLTAEGVRFFQGRLAGENPGWNTTADLARAIHGAMTSAKGGKVEVSRSKGATPTPVEFNRKVTV